MINNCNEDRGQKTVKHIHFSCLETEVLIGRQVKFKFKCYFKNLLKVDINNLKLYQFYCIIYLIISQTNFSVKERGDIMAEIRVGENESLDNALKKI